MIRHPLDVIASSIPLPGRPPEKMVNGATRRLGGVSPEPVEHIEDGPVGDVAAVDVGDFELVPSRGLEGGDNSKTSAS